MERRVTRQNRGFTTNRRTLNTNMRLINRRIRALYLNSEPVYHVVKGGAIDPPPYKNDATYQRKVRLVRTATPDPIQITYPQIVSAVWSDRGTFFPFLRLAISEIIVWGPASANSPIEVQPTNLLLQGSQTITKQFSDFGTQGSLRAKVHLKASMKDLEFTSSTNSLINIRAPTDAVVIIDLIVHFTDTNDISPVTALLRQDGHCSGDPSNV
jgi:hypothetical protein